MRLYYSIQAPVLIMAGQKDKVTEYQYTVKLYEKIVSSEKKIYTLVDGLHQVYEDEESEECLTLMKDWISYRHRIYKMTSSNNMLYKIIVMPSIMPYYRWRNRLLMYIVVYFMFRIMRRRLFGVVKYLLDV